MIVLPKTKFIRLVFTRKYIGSLAMLSTILGSDSLSLNVTFMSIFGFNCNSPLGPKYPDFCCH